MAHIQTNLIFVALVCTDLFPIFIRFRLIIDIYKYFNIINKLAKSFKWFCLSLIYSWIILLLFFFKYSITSPGLKEVDIIGRSLWPVMGCCSPTVTLICEQKGALSYQLYVLHNK